MKSLSSLILAGILFINLFGCGKACQKNNDEKKTTLRIGTNANFPPYETIDNKGKLVGFDIDMGRELALQMGLVPEYKEFEFDALILALKRGQIDVIMSGLSITKSRQKEILMVPYQGKPLTTIAFLFWEQAPEDVKTLDELRLYAQKHKMSLSVQAGHFLEGFLREQNMPLKPLLGPPEQIIDIKYKKSLAAALDEVNAKSIAQKHPGLALLVIPLPEDKRDLGYGIGVAKTRPDLAEKVQEAVQKLKERGVTAELEKKWLGESP